jgi:hypothetical protein
MLTNGSQKLVAQKAKSQALAQEQLGLAAAKKSIAKYAELETISHAVVPEDKNQAEAVREIVNIAAANGIKLSTINFPASSLGNTASGTPIGASNAPAATPSPSSTVPTKSLSQLIPVKNIPGVYQLTISVTNDSAQTVRYDKFINFLSDLEHNRRTAQVNNITIQPDINDRTYLTFTLGLNEYIKP